MGCLPGFLCLSLASQLTKRFVQPFAVSRASETILLVHIDRSRSGIVSVCEGVAAFFDLP